MRVDHRLDQPAYLFRSTVPVAEQLTSTVECARAAAQLDVRLAQIAPAVQRGAQLADLEEKSLKREIAAIEARQHRLHEEARFPEGRRPMAMERKFRATLGDPVRDLEAAGEVQEATDAYKRAVEAGERAVTQEERQRAAEVLLKAGSALTRLGLDVPG